MGSYFRDFYSPTATQRPTVGDTKFSVINQDHMGWMRCDGRELSKATYNILYQVVGDAFGPSTATTFFLPNAEGRVPGAVGQAQTDDVNPTNTWVLGDLSGTETHQLTIAEMPEHDHGGQTESSTTGITANPHNHTGTANQASTAINGASNNTGNGGTTGNTTVTLSDPGHRHDIPLQGGDQPHNNMQPTIFIGNMFIFSGKVRPSATNYYPYTPRGPIF
jgi:microcystin-dependent protein